MARTYLAAFLAIRPIRRVMVYSPTVDHRETYAREMAEVHGIEVIPVGDARTAVAGADIVALCVSALDPVFEADWLEPGMHVANVTQASTRPDFVECVDRAFWHGNQTPLLDPLPPDVMYARGGYLSWVAGGPAAMADIPHAPPPTAMLELPTLLDLIGGRAAGRTTSAETTFFHNIGNVGPQFVAVAGSTYEAALAAGVGTDIPTAWFLEDVRD
jgi:ornithine cyclodeaminase/alanine dehydrogenase-like protein (mu-crystallin family)